MIKTSKIYVAGHNGMVGSAIVRKLRKVGYDNIVVRTSAQLDLRNQATVDAFLKKRSRNLFFSQRQKWVASLPTIPIVLSFYTTT